MTTYNPGALLNEAKRVLGLTSDAALCDKLNVDYANLSRVRNSKQQIGASLILKLHEIGGMSLPDIRHYIGGEA